MKILAFILGCVVGGLVVFSFDLLGQDLDLVPGNLQTSPTPIPRPLLSYRFETLSQYTSTTTELSWLEETTRTDLYKVSNFSFVSEGKQISGVSHQPLSATNSGTVVLIRGYVPSDRYYPGAGTNPIAAYLASRGYQTFAPDFLGYGSSDPESDDAFAARVVRPVAVLDLLSALESSYQLEPEQIGIWGHSNGGQIALSVLGITGKAYPTVLWAPVTKPFPYSILYYTDEPPDYGRILRKDLAAFESLYSAEDYSLPGVINRITAPIQLHQGGQDTAVPVSWSRQFVESYQATTSARPALEYLEYPRSDHNMRPDWNQVAAATERFFDSFLN